MKKTPTIQKVITLSLFGLVQDKKGSASNNHITTFASINDTLDFNKIRNFLTEEWREFLKGKMPAVKKFRYKVSISIANEKGIKFKTFNLDPNKMRRGKNMFTEEIRVKNKPDRVYYQAKSEIDDVTNINPSFHVYHKKENCEKAFPDSTPIAMGYQTIECPHFIDLEGFSLDSKTQLEALDYILHDSTYISWEDTDDNDEPACGDDFGFVIVEKEEDLPSHELVISKMKYIGSKISRKEDVQEMDNIGKMLSTAREDLKVGKGVVFVFSDF